VIVRVNLAEVKKSLERQFDREHSQGSKRNIVFWYDEEGVFADSIDTLAFDNVKLIKLYNNNMFAVKMYIEETDRESNLLGYSPLPRLPMSSAVDIGTVPAELFVKFQTSFYTNPEDAVSKALGLE